MNGPSVRINDLIRVGISENHESHPSRVEELLGQYIVIAWPTERGVPIPLKEQQSLLISFNREGMVYAFEAVVQSKTLTPIALVTVHPASAPEPIERRNNVRINEQVPVDLNAKVVSISSFRHSHENDSRIRTHTHTLSAGGFTIHHQSALPLGALLDVRMELPGKYKPLDMTAKVVRCQPIAGTDGQNLFEIGLQYARITEGARARIMRFVFRVQARQLRASAEDKEGP